VDLAPGELRAQVGLAAILQETGCYAEALPVWDAAIALAPGAERPRTMRAFCATADVPDEPADVFAQGQFGLEGLRRDPMQLDRQFDWVMKKAMIESFMARKRWSGASAVALRHSSRPMPSLSASSSKSCSCASAACGTPKPRKAPAGTRCVWIARVTAR